MAKKKQTRRARQSSDENDDITPEKLLGYFTAAYVLDAAVLLDPEKKKRLNSLRYPGCPTWDQAVEESYGINRTFIRSVFALCTEIKDPQHAVVFILRGLGCPDYEMRLVEVTG